MSPSCENVTPFAMVVRVNAALGGLNGAAGSHADVVPQGQIPPQPSSVPHAFPAQSGVHVQLVLPGGQVHVLSVHSRPDWHPAELVQPPPCG